MFDPAETSESTTEDWGTEPSAAPLAWHMLACHSPVTLLMDLARPDGPGSRDLLDDEGMPDGDWIPEPVADPV